MTGPKPEMSPVISRAVLNVVLHGCLCLGGGLVSLFWVPTLVESYKDFGARLPAATQWVIQMSFWLRQWAFFLMPAGFFLLLMDGLIYWLLHRSFGKAIARIYFGFVLAGLAFLDVGILVAAVLPRFGTP